MRMPLFSYFTVTGAALTLALLFVSDRLEPQGPLFETSQTLGIAKPFRPEPEPSPYRITATNFAAPHNPAAATPARAGNESKRPRGADLAQKQKQDDRGRPAWRRVADNPIAAIMSIH